MTHTERSADATAFVQMTPPVAKAFAVLIRQAARYGLSELTEDVRVFADVHENAELRAQVIRQSAANLYIRAANGGYAVLACRADDWRAEHGGWSSTVRVATVPLSEVE